jgi:repressor LexA
MDKLTGRQRDILDFLDTYIRAKGYPPTIREIRDAFRLRSNRGIIDHLRALERKGWIRRARGSSRAIEIIGRDGCRTRGSRAPGGGIVYPVAGRVAAGRPAPPVEEANERLVLDESFFGEAGDFILEVSGDSMTGDHIVPGDLLVVKRVKECAPGDIVVALVDGEATVKRFHQSADGAVLRPANPRYRPIHLSASATENAEVIGKVVGVIRRISSRRRPFSR